MPSKDKYTDPKLRDEIKEELQQSDKGGAPGQWSARKAQMMASEYKKRGGDYNTDKSEKDESQKHLDDWGKEDWQTKEGSGNAKQKDGSEKRYLPKKAWENMTEEEKKETDDKKQKESKKGKQYVENTEKAKESRRKASESDKDDKKKSVKRHDSAQDEAGSEGEQEFQPDAEMEDANDDKENAQSETNNQQREEPETAKTGKKRGRAQKQESGSSKKQKSSNTAKSNAKAKQSKNDESDSKDEDEREDAESDEQDEDDEPKSGKQPKSKSAKRDGEKKTIGSKHMDATEPAQKGSADRLPKKGQAVQWKAMPGYVAGKLVEVLKKDKSVDGKSFKASEKDPKLVLKSDSSGKICVHKPETCFYD